MGVNIKVRKGFQVAERPFARAEIRGGTGAVKKHSVLEGGYVKHIK
jgi:hypothetical protein